MISFFNDFVFLRPSFLWLLPLAFFFYFFKQKSVLLSSSWEKVCDQPLLKYLLSSPQNFHKKWRLLLLLLGLVSAIIGAAGPSFEKKELPSLSKENPILFVLNLSSDINRTDIRPSRLARAKIEIKDILLEGSFDPSGLIVYTDEPFLISPLSSDPNLIINLLNAIQTNIMPVGGNRLDRAIDFASERLSLSGYIKGNIVVLTNALQLHAQDAFAAAQKAAQKGFAVSVYEASVGKDSNLVELAQKGNGFYLNSQRIDNNAFIHFLEKTSSGELSESQNKLLTEQDNGWWFVLFSALCFLLILPKGVFVFLIFMFFTNTANAGFFFNSNQEGALLFSSKEYQKAAQKFEDEDWKASAYYRAGDYQHASQIFGKKDDVTSLYNKGNALAKGGQIPQAIKTYEKVLQKDPSHEDAKFNLEYLKKMMQNEQQSKNDENKRQENPQNENQQNSQSSAGEDQNNDDNAQAPQETQDNNEEQNNEQQNEQEQNSSSEKSEDESQEQSGGQNNNENSQENDLSREQQKTPLSRAKEQQADEYDETVQAREQQFREIKDDPGGLLKAFIVQEYQKKRYD